LKVWLMETRPQFLILTPICFSLGLAVAFSEGHLNALNALLGLLGSTLAHISVNVLNDYFDYRSGLDLRTRRTPFSGGSGILPAGLLPPWGVYLLGVTSLLLGASIGVYFILTLGWQLIPLIAAAGATIYLYTTHLARWYLGELSAGLGFGPFMVLGAYFTQTGSYSLNALVPSIVPGILVATLLFLNEFPDMEVDREAGRRNLVILLGRRRAARVYVLLILSAYLSAISGILLGFMPWTALLSLFTLPIALKAVRGTLEYFNEVEKLIPALAANVTVVLGTTALMALGIFINPLLVRA